MNNTYYIKPGYKARMNLPNIERLNYWNETRIKTSEIYQYYVYLHAKEIITDQKKKSFLDIGSGPGTKVQKLIKPVCNEIVLVDHSTVRDLSHKICPDAEFIECNLEKAEINLDRNFDIILCADVLEHLMKPENCMNMIKKHMSDTSVLILSTPDRDVLHGVDCFECVHEDHIREWNSKEFNEFILSMNLKIIDSFFSPQAKLEESELGNLENNFNGYDGKLACYIVICSL